MSGAVYSVFEQQNGIRRVNDAMWRDAGRGNSGRGIEESRIGSGFRIRSGMLRGREDAGSRSEQTRILDAVREPYQVPRGSRREKSARPRSRTPLGGQVSLSMAALRLVGHKSRCPRPLCVRPAAWSQPVAGKQLNVSEDHSETAVGFHCPSVQTPQAPRPEGVSRR